MALEYFREYRTYFHIGRSYGMSESKTYKIIKWIEDTLVKHPDFALPGRKEVLKSDMEYEVLVIDATETLVERPKKAKKILFRKKEKAQYKNTDYAEKESKKIICTSFSNGRKHDFRLFKESKVHKYQSPSR
ncbi:MAG: hypothetical protein PG981_001544 [Wolbachia endosymbiont of Ctenocephalides orientis wCori]|nr:MAG: hypothetical protein PG981_001544 [Wolbachia endosymbiont of Ctenocephalides orientis wCori]